jgi:hypothetical protein
MRAAVLVSGEPRFCKELDLFMERVTGFDRIDWFACLWNRNQPVSDYWRSQQSQLVAPAWLEFDHDWAWNRIKSNLPVGHHLAQLELQDQYQLTFASHGRDDGVTNVANGWKMYWGNWRTDQMRQQQEQQQGWAYDLVIKIRPDMMLHDTLDLVHCARILNASPNAVIMPNNTRAGYGYAVSDLMALGTGTAMATYAGCYHYIEHYVAQGKIFHPETILGDYLKHKGITIQTAGFNIDIRQLGQRISANQYISDFGRWA